MGEAHRPIYAPITYTCIIAEVPVLCLRHDCFPRQYHITVAKILKKNNTQILYLVLIKAVYVWSYYNH
jgi:hypothetical protein